MSKRPRRRSCDPGRSQTRVNLPRLSRTCQPCMLDPLCGFCYRDNGTAVYDSSCVPANRTYANVASWGRSGSPGVYLRAGHVTGAANGPLFLSIQMLQPVGGCGRSVLGLQLLSHVLLLAGSAGPPPLSGLLCSRSRTQSLRKCSPPSAGVHRVFVPQGWAPCRGP